MFEASWIDELTAEEAADELARVRDLVRAAEANGRDLVSQMARLRVSTFWERRIVPAFVYLFAFSLGVCALLAGVGLASGVAGRLPRPGMWMVWVKRGFALVMIGVAQYYLIEMGKLLI